jgi:starch phosphorylase
MHLLRTLVVVPRVPEELSALQELAYNYWWCWDAEAQSIFARMEPNLWEEVHHNPVALLQRIPQQRLEELARDAEFRTFLDYIVRRFRTLLDARSWYTTVAERPQGAIVYFSAEYGIHESFPNYSGGLGVLSGDYLKTASDLGVPLVGVGLLYQYGYFQQRLTAEGWQHELYPVNDFSLLPLTLVRTEDGSPLQISLPFPKGQLYARVWRMLVGRVSLYLLDTNYEANALQEYREITWRLYGGDVHTRIQQELLLGIGGMRALEALGIRPAVCHLNEGHTVFAALEWLAQLIREQSLDFATALEVVRASTVFVTHTPVPAGNEVFAEAVLRPYLEVYAAESGIPVEEVLRLGETMLEEGQRGFGMTVFGLNLSFHRRAVSRLHGRTARQMWHHLWADFPVEEVPIGSITNGVHTLSWVAPEMARLYDRYLGPRWRSDPDDPELWQRVELIPAEELWQVHEQLRERLVQLVRARLRQRYGIVPAMLDPEALTIGFARRIALYKRPELLFTDVERLRRLVSNAERPVQIIIAGKAHPQDIPAKELIQRILRTIREQELAHAVVFLEDYSIELARALVQGCDVWLNTPRRPLEASGTSGMKAALNGVLHVSTRDGWWDEAYNGSNGFAIGEGIEHLEPQQRDATEAELLYDVLEQHVVPLFYERNAAGVPERWVGMMKNAIRTLAGTYSCARMLRQYVRECYFPAMALRERLLADGAQAAHQLAQWRHSVAAAWQQVRIVHVQVREPTESRVGERLGVSVMVELGSLPPEWVRVELVLGRLHSDGSIGQMRQVALELAGQEGSLYRYEGGIELRESGLLGYAVRVVPWHPLLPSSAEARLCRWAEGWTVDAK